MLCVSCTYQLYVASPIRGVLLGADGGAAGVADAGAVPARGAPAGRGVLRPEGGVDVGGGDQRLQRQPGGAGRAEREGAQLRDELLHVPGQLRRRVRAAVAAHAGGAAVRAAAHHPGVHVRPHPHRPGAPDQGAVHAPRRRRRAGRLVGAHRVLVRGGAEHHGAVLRRAPGVGAARAQAGARQGGRHRQQRDHLHNLGVQRLVRQPPRHVPRVPGRHRLRGLRRHCRRRPVRNDTNLLRALLLSPAACTRAPLLTSLCVYIYTQSSGVGAVQREVHLRGELGGGEGPGGDPSGAQDRLREQRRRGAAQRLRRGGIQERGVLLPVAAGEPHLRELQPPRAGGAHSRIGGQQRVREIDCDRAARAVLRPVGRGGDPRRRRHPPAAAQVAARADGARQPGAGAVRHVHQGEHTVRQGERHDRGGCRRGQGGQRPQLHLAAAAGVRHPSKILSLSLSSPVVLASCTRTCNAWNGLIQYVFLTFKKSLSSFFNENTCAVRVR
jgi:hypothetical protein